MCVMSLVMDHRYNEWQRRYYPMNPVLPIENPAPSYSTVPTQTEYWPPSIPTQEEIDEFRRLLEKAREYDKEHNEPDCEIEEKREKLRKLAVELGVEIDFV